MSLFQDDEYIELAETAIKKIRAAVNKKEVISKYGSRAINLIRSQNNYDFVDTMIKNIDNGKALTESIYRKGENLIKQIKTIPFSEGHHRWSVGSWSRFQNFPLKKILQVNEILKSKGLLSGTVAESLAFLSRNIHSGDEALAHINPWFGETLLKGAAKTTDTGIWASKQGQFLPIELPDNWQELFGTTNKKHARLLLKAQKDALNRNRLSPFNRNIDAFSAANKFIDQSLLPQDFLTSAAFNDPSEVAARKAITEILGSDVFNIKDPSKAQNIYKITSAAGINMNEFYDLAKNNKLPDLSKSDESLTGLRALIDKARKGVKIKPPELSSIKNIVKSPAFRATGAILTNASRTLAAVDPLQFGVGVHGLATSKSTEDTIKSTVNTAEGGLGTAAWFAPKLLSVLIPATIGKFQHEAEENIRKNIDPTWGGSFGGFVAPIGMQHFRIK